MYVLYVCKDCILSLSVYECRNKPSMSVCYMCVYTLCVKYDFQCQDNQFDVINYHFSG